MPFDVGCARCGHDLRGLTEPKCPACGLEFDWSDAVPIEELTCERCRYRLYGLQETRCPECGQQFMWEEVLAAHYRRKKPLFEYRWRNYPVRSLARSWLLAIRPWKLWRTVDIHDPPAIDGIVRLLVVASLVFIIAFPVLSNLGGLGIRLLEQSAIVQQRNVMRFGSAFAPWRSYCGPWQWGWHWYPPWLVCVGLWAAMSFLGLLLLQESMRLCRVRTAHVFRVSSYAVLPVAVAPALYCLVAFALDVFLTWFPPSANLDALVSLIPLSVGFLAWCWATMSIAIAYQRYIRMQHAWAVALATQVIASLTMVLAILRFVLT